MRPVCVTLASAWERGASEQAKERQPKMGSHLRILIGRRLLYIRDRHA